MSVQTLPVELLNAVCDSLSQRDLLALARTNYSLSWVARRRIYEHIDISALDEKLGALETLAHSPYHAFFVRSFSITAYKSTLVDSKKNISPEMFYTLLATALSKMTNLLSLSIHLDEDASWVLPDLGPSAFPYLEQFDTSFGFDDHTIKFLASTDNIWALTLGSSPCLPTTTLAPHLLPKLSVFQGSALAAQTLVPGRPLTSVHITSGDLTDSVVDALARSTNHVSVLSATTGVAPAPLLNLLAKNLMRLSKLWLMTTHIYPGPPDNAFIEDIDVTLQDLPFLEEFHLSGVRWQATPSTNRQCWHPPVFGKVLPLDDDEAGYLA